MTSQLALGVLVVVPAKAAESTEKQLEKLGYRKSIHLTGLVAPNILAAPAVLALSKWFTSRMSWDAIGAVLYYGIIMYHLGPLWFSFFRLEDYTAEEQQTLTESGQTWALMPTRPESKLPAKTCTVDTVRSNMIRTTAWKTSCLLLLDFSLIWVVVTHVLANEDRLKEKLGTITFAIMAIGMILPLLGFPPFMAAHLGNKIEDAGYTKSPQTIAAGIARWGVILPAAAMFLTPLRNGMPWYVSLLTANYGLMMVYMGQVWFTVYGPTSDQKANQAATPENIEAAHSTEKARLEHV